MQELQTEEKQEPKQIVIQQLQLQPLSPEEAKQRMNDYQE